MAAQDAYDLQTKGGGKLRWSKGDGKGMGGFDQGKGWSKGGKAAGKGSSNSSNSKAGGKGPWTVCSCGQVWLYNFKIKDTTICGKCGEFFLPQAVGSSSTGGKGKGKEDVPKVHSPHQTLQGFTFKDVLKGLHKEAKSKGDKEELNRIEQFVPELKEEEKPKDKKPMSLAAAMQSAKDKLETAKKAANTQLDFGQALSPVLRGKGAGNQACLNSHHS